MLPRRCLVVVFSLAALAALAPNLGTLLAEPAAQSFDKLADADREVLFKRFEKEVWPLLKRHGKDGCVGCHNAKLVSALRLSGDPAKDFRFMLREGFLLKDDDGSLLARIVDKDVKRRMPPGKLPRWTEDETKVLRAFVLEVDKKQKK